MPLTKANVAYSSKKNAAIMTELFEVSNLISEYLPDKNAETSQKVVTSFVEGLTSGSIQPSEAEEFCATARKILTKPKTDNQKLFSSGGLTSLAKNYIKSIVGDTKDTNLIDMGKSLFEEYNKSNEHDSAIDKGLAILLDFNKSSKT